MLFQFSPTKLLKIEVLDVYCPDFRTKVFNCSSTYRNTFVIMDRHHFHRSITMRKNGVEYLLVDKHMYVPCVASVNLRKVPDIHCWKDERYEGRSAILGAKAWPPLTVFRFGIPLTL